MYTMKRDARIHLSKGIALFAILATVLLFAGFAVSAQTAHAQSSIFPSSGSGVGNNNGTTSYPSDGFPFGFGSGYGGGSPVIPDASQSILSNLRTTITNILSRVFNR